MSMNLEELYEKAAQPLKNEKGQGLVEYALILVLIALVVMAAVHTVGNSTKNTFDKVNTQLNTPTN